MAENIPQRARRSSTDTPSPPVQAVELPDPPEHLSEEASEMWRSIVGQWVLDVDGLLLLRGAMEQWDDYQRARAVVDQEGPTVTHPNTGNVRAHPAAKLALDALKEFRMCFRQLGLEPPQ